MRNVLLSLFKVFILCLCSLLFSSCVFFELKKDLKNIKTTGTIHGKIINNLKIKAPLILFVYDEDGNVLKVKYLYADSDYYAFSLPVDKIYKMVLFEDIDNNLKHSINEPGAFWDNYENIKLTSEKGIVKDLIISQNIKISQKYLTDLNKVSQKLRNQFMVKVGKITDLKADIFSSKYGRKGLWTPYKFFKENGIGVYFMDKYDSNKVPILFVYGIGGYAQIWETFFQKIDRTKFQPWFYFYPSGSRIHKSGEALNIIMNQLHLKYKFKKMFILAHSMGGLVAKEFIKESLKKSNDDFIKLFISISTPWGGDKDAEWAKHAPAVIPCWNDLPPQSKFIMNSSSKDIGDKIPFYLLFSYRGDRKPFRLNNDNVVYLASELKLDMQKRANKIYGFDLNHSQILKDDDVINICNDIFIKYFNIQTPIGMDKE